MLPSPIASADADPADLIFSEERAFEHITALTERVGKRLAGTRALRHHSVAWLNETVQAIRADMAAWEKKHGKPLPLTLEVSLQTVDGALIFDFAHNVITNVYTSLSNVLVRLSPSAAVVQENTLLVNSHLDTCIDSPGASDDGLNVAVMLEVIRVLALSGRTLRHPIVFLFNGGEESLQEASHGFITKHPWASDIKAVVNLDTTGSGGRDAMVQVGTPALAALYASVAPHPHGIATANDVFETGLLIGDTDYQIFARHGNVLGFDLVGYHDSYVYHTPRDLPEHIAPGSVQHTGDNTLAVVVAMANSTTFLDDADGTNVGKHARAVFFSFLSLKMITYPLSLAMWLHAGMGVVVAYMAYHVHRVHQRNVAVELLDQTASFVAGILAAGAVGAVLGYGLDAPLAWFNKKHAVPVLAGCAGVVGMMAVRLVRPVENTRARLFAALVWHTAMMGLMSWAGLASSANEFIFVASAVGGFAINSLANPPRGSFAPIAWLVTLALPSVVTIEVYWGMFDMVVPLMGRIGYSIPVDVVLPAAAFLFLSPVLMTALAVVEKRHVRNVLLCAAALCAACVVALAVTHPFDHAHPKRLFVQHAEFRNGTEAQSKVLVSNISPGHLDTVLADYDRRHELTYGHPDHYWDALYPINYFLNGYVLANATAQSYIPTPRVDVLADSYDAGADERSLRLRIEYTGCEWSTLKFSDGRLRSWTVTDRLPPVYHGHYMLRHIGGHGSRFWDIGLVLSGPEAMRFDVSATHFVQSADVKHLVAQLPDWVSPVSSMTSVMVSYTL